MHEPFACALLAQPSRAQRPAFVFSSLAWPLSRPAAVRRRRRLGSLGADQVPTTAEPHSAVRAGRRNSSRRLVQLLHGGAASPRLRGSWRAATRLTAGRYGSSSRAATRHKYQIPAQSSFLKLSFQSSRFRRPTNTIGEFSTVMPSILAESPPASAPNTLNTVYRIVGVRQIH